MDMKKPIADVHIAITLREEWPTYEPDGAYVRDTKAPTLTGLFKTTNEASKDKGYLWGYYGEYYHTPAGMGHSHSFPERNVGKKKWKALYSKARKDERDYLQHCESHVDEPYGGHF